MSDEKNDFLNALGRRDLELDLSPHEIDVLRSAMKKLASTARLVHAAADRPEEATLDDLIAMELLAAAESPSFAILERTQLARVLDENGEIIRRDLTFADVPPEDADFLAQCGIKNPKDEIVISVTRLKAGYWPVDSEGRGRLGTAQIFEYSRTQITRAAEELSGRDDNHLTSSKVQATEPKKRRKYFNGIGKILSGVVAGTGNVLIGTGAIPATGGAAVAGVIASAAVSVGIVMQGIGDLRGE